MIYINDLIAEMKDICKSLPAQFKGYVILKRTKICIYLARML